MIFNYIVKSVVGVYIDENGEVFNKVEKSSFSSPVDVLDSYKKHLDMGYNPVILKRDGHKWNPVTVLTIQLDVRKKRKTKGVKKAYRVNIKNIGWLNVGV